MAIESLKELRKIKKLTQPEVAEALGISLRSYKTYENDPEKRETFKYRYIFDRLMALNPMDENHGMQTVEDIKTGCSNVLKNYDVDYCILFGSYAKGNANESSDVDLLIETKNEELDYEVLKEDLKSRLFKCIDLISEEDLKDNFELTRDVLRDGIKIYSKKCQH